MSFHKIELQRLLNCKTKRLSSRADVCSEGETQKHVLVSCGNATVECRALTTSNILHTICFRGPLKHIVYKAALGWGVATL